MGERLQWAVKNGDLDAVKELVEKVWKVYHVYTLYRLLVYSVRPLENAQLVVRVLKSVDFDFERRYSRWSGRMAAPEGLREVLCVEYKPKCCWKPTNMIQLYMYHTHISRL